MRSELPIVVCGLSPTGLYVARELAGGGFERVYGVTDEMACGEASNCFVRTLRSPFPELIGTLLKVAEEFDEKAVLLATSDRFIEAIAEHGDELSRRYLFQDSYRPEFVRQFLDKGEFRRLCDRHGVEAPGVFSPAGRRGFDEVAERASFPCILKPRRIHEVREYMAGRKVVVLQDRAALRRMLPKLPLLEDGWLVQEVVPGPESEIWLMSVSMGAEGRLLEGFVGRKLRQFPPGFGSASLARSQYCQEVEEFSLNLLRAVGYRGICGTEFKRDPRDGRLKIIEINPRPTLWFHLSHAAGKRIVLSAVSDLLGEEWQPLSRQQEDGVTWRYLAKDLVARRQWRGDTLSDLMPPPDIRAGHVAGAPRCFPVFSARDPMPAIRELQNYALKGVRRLWPAP